MEPAGFEPANSVRVFVTPRRLGTRSAVALLRHGSVFGLLSGAGRLALCCYSTALEKINRFAVLAFEVLSCYPTAHLAKPTGPCYKVKLFLPLSSNLTFTGTTPWGFTPPRRGFSIMPNCLTWPYYRDGLAH